MKFGPVPVDRAEGSILAHSTRAGGRTMKKGRVLARADVQNLISEGIEDIVVASLEVGDVHEDPAAEALASVCAGDGVRRGAPFTGRCNLYANHAGLLQIDAARLDAVNQVDSGITVATLPPNVLVTPKQMLATIKIIPFAVDGRRLSSAQDLLKAGGPVVKVAPFTGMRAALIQTYLATTKPSVLDKTERVMGARLAHLDGALVMQSRCEHSAGAVADEVRAAVSSGVDVVLIAGASAIVDQRDVLPAGIEEAGGKVDHFGMPVDPGNLILLARHGNTPVLGLPGCARSPKYNGVDRVLERLSTGVNVAPRDIMLMGPGGLLKEIAERPQPRGGTSEQRGAPARAPRVGVLLMAAGQSRRMGITNKLLVELDGVPMVRLAAQAALASSADSVHVVLGHQGQEVRAALQDLPVRFVENPQYEDGMSTSVAAGVAGLPGDLDASVVCLGDMPKIDPDHIDRLIAAFDPVEGRLICVPTFRGKRGNPVLWGSQFFPEICALRGDVGARHLIGEHSDQVCEVAMPDDGVLVDVDSPDALTALIDKTGIDMTGQLEQGEVPDGD